MLGAFLVVGTLPFSAGCRDAGESGVMSRERYIALYVEILRAADSAEDTLAAFRRASEILAEHGFSHDDLDAFTTRHASDPEYLAEVWEEIEQRLRAPPGQDEEADTDDGTEEGEGESAEDPQDRPEDASDGRL